MSMKLLSGPSESEEHQADTNIERWIMVGVVVIFVTFGIFGTWAALASLTSAALAPGVVAVDSNWRTVQHLEGGIVAQLLVRDGQAVEEGQVLLRLDPTRSDATLSIIDSQLVLALATEARLLAERDGAEAIALPPELADRMDDAAVGTIVAGQQLLFNARKDSLEGQSGILRQRIDQLQQEIQGLEVQQDATRQQYDLIQEELAGLKELFEQGYVPRTRILALEREAEQLRGARGEDLAAIARARSQIGETELQIMQAERSFREEVVTELRDVQSQVYDLRERRVAAADERRRIDVIAPVTGHVINLAVHTLGGVVKPGENILSIVPDGDELVIDARVKPDDRERVTAGQSAQVRLSGLSMRTTPMLLGEVKTISADRLTDSQTGEAYYQARIVIPEEQLARLDPSIELVPGMPAEVMIETGERSALGYMLAPITDSLKTAFRD